MVKNRFFNLFLISFLNINSEFIRQLYCLNIVWITMGGLHVKNISEKGRKELEEKLSGVFNDKIGDLSPELQEILLDDIVTAFENRLKVLTNINNKANS
jgi:hypothetical protein